MLRRCNADGNVDLVAGTDSFRRRAAAFTIRRLCSTVLALAFAAAIAIRMSSSLGNSRINIEAMMLRRRRSALSITAEEGDVRWAIRVENC